MDIAGTTCLLLLGMLIIADLFLQMTSSAAS